MVAQVAMEEVVSAGVDLDAGEGRVEERRVDVPAATPIIVRYVLVVIPLENFPFVCSALLHLLFHSLSPRCFGFRIPRSS